MQCTVESDGLRYTQHVPGSVPKFLINIILVVPSVALVECMPL